MAASRLAIALTGLLVSGVFSADLSNPATAEDNGVRTPATEAGSSADGGASANVEASTKTVLVPEQLELKADRQFYDSKRKITIAEGNVTARLGEAQLQADRIEFDTAFRTLFARGSVRLRRGNQFFQASVLRYNLVQNEGELDDVYGVIDLEDTPAALPKPANKPTVGRSSTEYNSQSAEEKLQSNSETDSSMACTPFLPPVPDWHPQPWAVTAWGGQMIDAAFGDTFLFNGRMRPEAVMGVGLQKRIARAGPIALELEADLFSHVAKQQQGGEYNQDTPYADLPAQSFGEGVLGIGARLWVQPWLSFSLMEGVSYNTDQSLYEKTFRKNYSQLLNYLGFELEAAVSQDLSLVGRIHHRSGAFGTYNGVTEGSNAYLLGLRYRWGRDLPNFDVAVMPPPDGCPDPDRDQRINPSSLSERLESIALGDGGEPQQHVPLAKSTKPAEIAPAEQQAMRTAAIQTIDQRVSDIDLTGSFSIERRSGVPIRRLNSSVQDENRFGVVKVPQLKRLGSTKLLNGTISRWRIQANRIRITAKGWQSDRMGFSNDPFTPSQSRIDAEGVIAREQPNGDLLISARRNRLIIDERLPIPVTRRQLIAKEEEIENRWVLGIDNEDRGGLFVGRTIPPITIGNSTELALEPQVLLQRAFSDGGENLGDIFGLEAKLTSRVGGYRLNSEADISSFDGDSFLDNSRYWVDLGRNVDLGFLGEVQTKLFGAYRYRTWNGSLGETDIQAAYGMYGEKSGEWSQGDIEHRYLVRGAVGDYYADRFKKKRMLRTGRGSLFASLTSNFPLWKGKRAELTPTEAYRYSPVAIVPGVSLATNINSTVAMYGQGSQQSSLSFSGGPTVTLGTFSKPFLDFTQISVIGGGTLQSGASPFEFDRIVDFGTLGVGITQQIVGPLMFSTGVNLNVDPGSAYYGEVIDSNFELRWQRRSYDIGLYFNPYEGIGGVRFRLNDFKFKGTGVPFVPYAPTDWLNHNSKNQPF